MATVPLDEKHIFAKIDPGVKPSIFLHGLGCFGMGSFIVFSKWQRRLDETLTLRENAQLSGAINLFFACCVSLWCFAQGLLLLVVRPPRAESSRHVPILRWSGDGFRGLSLNPTSAQPSVARRAQNKPKIAPQWPKARPQSRSKRKLQAPSAGPDVVHDVDPAEPEWASEAVSDW